MSLHQKALDYIDARLKTATPLDLIQAAQALPYYADADQLAAFQGGMARATASKNAKCIGLWMLTAYQIVHWQEAERHARAEMRATLCNS